MHYPVLQYPTQKSKFEFDKTPSFQGKLSGIKGSTLFLTTAPCLMLVQRDT
jgi:hypothetical protein